MKEIHWNADKNKDLKQARNVTFEQLMSSRFIGIEKHPKKPHQQLMLFEFNPDFAIKIDRQNPTLPKGRGRLFKSHRDLNTLVRVKPTFCVASVCGGYLDGSSALTQNLG